jgi:4'-phosphopantetheinyl transferase
MTSELWFFPLQCDGAMLAEGEQLLSDDERHRASRFRFDEHRRRFIVRRAMRRIVLGRLAGTDPAAVRFETSEHGKPRLAGIESALEFSASHSGDLGLVVTGSRVVGADLEVLDRPMDYLRFAEHHFTREEHSEIARHHGDRLRIAFFNCWTAKEAYLKALGHGLTRSLESFAVRCEPGGNAGLIRDSDDPSATRCWHFTRYGDGSAIATVVTPATEARPDIVIHILGIDSLVERVPVAAPTQARWQES